MGVEMGGGMRQNADTHTKRARAVLALALPDGHWGIPPLSPRSSSFIRGNTGLVDVRVSEDSKWLPSGPAL